MDSNHSASGVMPLVPTHSPALADIAPLTARTIWRQPLPFLEREPLTRFLLRSVLLAFRGRVTALRGLESVAVDRDPFVLAPNHSQKLEAILLPSLLFFYRGGKPVHFLSDWNFRMIPGLALILRRARTIILMNKSARPRFLNVLKPLFDPGVPGWVRARQKLEAGGSVGVYPEGTINRDPKRLLKGYSGAARLSLMTQVPVVPVGITFPGQAQDRPIGGGMPLSIEFGGAMTPPHHSREPSLVEIRDWHQQIMLAISRLSHKEWQPECKRRHS